jgi:Raf kinase inhibitor-like YbhB/YbcL family protein
MDDPDAPGGTFTHWVVYNLPPSTYSLPTTTGALPASALVGLTSRGQTGYAPVCPPSGRHRYRIRIFALDAKLPEMGRATAEGLEAAMSKHLLAEGRLYGTYAKGTPSP